MVRLLVTLLAVGFSIPLSAACPLVTPQAKPDCCHKSECPKPAQAQPCFECVADVRTSAVTGVQMGRTVVPELAILPVRLALARARAELGPVFFRDRSSTYLRIGVLRL